MDAQVYYGFGFTNGETWDDYIRWKKGEMPTRRKGGAKQGEKKVTGKAKATPKRPEEVSCEKVSIDCSEVESPGLGKKKES